MGATTRSKAKVLSSPPSYGDFARLPPEIRREIWRFALLANRNMVSREGLIMRDREVLTDAGASAAEPGTTHVWFPLLPFRLAPKLLCTSRAIYEEAADVLYRENLFVRVHLAEFYGDLFELATKTLDCSDLRSITPSYVRHRKQERTRKAIRECRLNVMDVHVVLTDEEHRVAMARLDDISEVAIFPLFEIDHFIPHLHSMMVQNDGNRHFGNFYNLKLKVRNTFDMSSDELYRRLLLPFQGLYGFNQATIRGVERTSAVRLLEESLWEGAILNATVDLRVWCRQMLKLFYTVYKRHKDLPCGVEKRDAYQEVIDNIAIATTKRDNYGQLHGCDFGLLHNIKLWSELMVWKSEMNIIDKLGPHGPSRDLEWRQQKMYENVEADILCCKDNDPVLGVTSENGWGDTDWFYEKMRIMLYSSWAYCLLHRGRLEEAGHFLARVAASSMATRSNQAGFEKFKIAYHKVKREEFATSDAKFVEYAIKPQTDFQTEYQGPETWTPWRVDHWINWQEPTHLYDDSDSEEDDDDDADEDDDAE